MDLEVQASNKYKLDFKITSSINFDNETITLVEEYCGILSKEIIDTKDKLIRDCLIKLGWTPPK